MARIPVASVPTLLPKLNLQHSAFFELGSNLYIYDTLRTEIGIAVSASNHDIKLYEPGSLQPKGSLKYHSGQLTQIKAQQNKLLSSSLDGQIAIWDLRQALTAPAVAFTADDPVLSFDMAADETMLVGGTQLNSDGSAKINFWDTRAAGGRPLKVFEDSHSDDVTQIQCHPSLNRQFLSASTDGLLCTFDVSQMDEDEALQYVANTGASVSRAGYFGPDAQFIYAQSDMETLQLWTNEATLLADFGDVRDIRESGVIIDYMIGCRYEPQSQRLYMLAGTNGGDVHVLHVGAGSLEHIQKLASGHSGIVRGFDWDPAQGWAVSGGEDGRLSWWSTETPASQPSSVSASPVAEGSKKPNGGRRFNPY
ncbi:WD40 repeat-like protein [Martensiomyces pterosporus]|nr:WD40 repeat-like protein [Martensiomyces pterosporus]